VYVFASQIRSENVEIHDCVIRHISASIGYLEDWIIGNRKTAATFDKVSVVVDAITRLATPRLTNERSAIKARVTWIFFVKNALNSEASMGPRAITIEQRSRFYGMII